MRTEPVDVLVQGTRLSGTLAAPETGLPGLLFLHGWNGSQEQDMDRAHAIAALGCVCLTFDLRGHVGTEALHASITPRDNLDDALAAYDTLAAHPAVDSRAICVVGSSYGAYLAAILTSVRPVKWLSMRVPALYRDADWTRSKAALDRAALISYRSAVLAIEGNRALEAAAAFRGDVLIVESERDDLVPHATIANYLGSFRRARSMTYRVIVGADHALTDPVSKRAYASLLVGWIREMLLGAR